MLRPKIGDSRAVGTTRWVLDGLISTYTNFDLIINYYVSVTHLNGTPLSLGLVAPASETEHEY